MGVSKCFHLQQIVMVTGSRYDYRAHLLHKPHNTVQLYSQECVSVTLLCQFLLPLQWAEYFNAPDRSSRQLFNVLSLSLAGTAMEAQVWVWSHCSVVVHNSTAAVACSKATAPYTSHWQVHNTFGGAGAATQLAAKQFVRPSKQICCGLSSSRVDLRALGAGDVTNELPLNGTFHTRNTACIQGASTCSFKHILPAPRLVSVRLQVSAPSMVYDLDLASQVWPGAAAGAAAAAAIAASSSGGSSTAAAAAGEGMRRKGSTPQSALLYCLSSPAGCYTDWHIDFGGSAVWYHVIQVRYMHTSLFSPQLIKQINVHVGSGSGSKHSSQAVSCYHLRSCGWAVVVSLAARMTAHFTEGPCEPAAWAHWCQSTLSP